MTNERIFMKTLKIIWKVDSLGKIVLPKKLRKYLLMDIDSQVTIYTVDEMIILKRYNSVHKLMCSIKKLEYVVINSYIKLRQ